MLPSERTQVADMSREGVFNIYSILQWLLVPVVIALPAVMIATERSGRNLARNSFRCWALAVVGIPVFEFILIVVFQVDLLEPSVGQPILGVIYFTNAVVFAFYCRATVQRLRDVGKGKALAYLVILPVTNIGLIFYLISAHSEPEPDIAG